jgi:transporter family-2 protein
VSASSGASAWGFWLLAGVAAIAGVATAFQPGVNARFAEAAGARIHGGVINFAVGCMVMLLVWLIARVTMGTPSPEASRLAAGPWWMWVGGVLGAFFVTTAVFLTPKIGAANYLVAMIAGQLFAAMIIDHFGLMGLRVVEISPMRVLGVGLVLAGAVVIKMSTT